MPDQSGPLRVLAVTNMYPTASDPSYGVFVATQMASIADLGATVRVEFVDGKRGDWQYLRAVGRIIRLAHSGAFDVVHAHYGLTGFVASFQRLPLVVSFCGDDLLGTPDGAGGATGKSRLAVRLSRIAACRADGIICKSEQLREALPREREQRRAHVIGNGVDTNRFAPGDREAARRRLGLNGGVFLVLFPHSLNQRAVKRFDLAVAAVRELNSSGMPARLWIVNGVLPSDMPDYYRAADCLLVTSDHEGSPNVVKEALCCDLPVVSVDVGDVQGWMRLAPGCQLVQRESGSIALGLRHLFESSRRVDGSEIRRSLALSVVARRVMAVYWEAIKKTTLQ